MKILCVYTKDLAQTTPLSHVLYLHAHVDKDYVLAFCVSVCT